MKTLHVPYAIATLALAFLFAIAVPNSYAKKLKDVPDDNTPVPTKVIKSVDLSAGTVEIQFSVDKSIHVYKVDTGTTIQVNGGQANFPISSLACKSAISGKEILSPWIVFR